MPRSYDETVSDAKLIFSTFVGSAAIVVKILVGIEEKSAFISLYFLFIA